MPNPRRPAFRVKLNPCRVFNQNVRPQPLACTGVRDDRELPRDLPFRKSDFVHPGLSRAIPFSQDFRASQGLRAEPSSQLVPARHGQSGGSLGGRVAVAAPPVAPLPPCYGDLDRYPQPCIEDLGVVDQQAGDLPRTRGVIGLARRIDPEQDLFSVERHGRPSTPRGGIGARRRSPHPYGARLFATLHLAGDCD